MFPSSWALGGASFQQSSRLARIKDIFHTQKLWHAFPCWCSLSHVHNFESVFSFCREAKNEANKSDKCNRTIHLGACTEECCMDGLTDGGSTQRLFFSSGVYCSSDICFVMLASKHFTCSKLLCNISWMNLRPKSMQEKDKEIEELRARLAEQAVHLGLHPGCHEVLSKLCL